MTAPVLDATPLGTGSNAYCDVAYGDVYFSGRLNASAWTDATPDNKTCALLMGTDLFERLWTWAGSLVTSTQRLRQPRTGVQDEEYRTYDPNVVPDLVKRGLCELALSLLTRDRTAEPEVLGLGMSQMQVGSLDVVVDADQRLAVFPANVVALLSNLGAPIDAADPSGGDQVVTLRRA